MIKSAADLIRDFVGEVQKDREKCSKDQSCIDDHDLNMAFKKLNGLLEQVVRFNF